MGYGLLMLIVGVKAWDWDSPLSRFTFWVQSGQHELSQLSHIAVRRCQDFNNPFWLIRLQGQHSHLVISSWKTGWLWSLYTSWKGWQIHGKHENVGMAQTQGRASIIIFQPQVHRWRPFEQGIIRPALRADTIILIIDLDFPEWGAAWSPYKVVTQVTQVSKERFHFKSLGSRRVRCCRAKGHLCLMRTRGHTELRCLGWSIGLAGTFTAAMFLF